VNRPMSQKKRRGNYRGGEQKGDDQETSHNLGSFLRTESSQRFTLDVHQSTSKVYIEGIIRIEKGGETCLA
jgi:hypothetical protein